ncbi:hypothetical protein KC315_g37 [Hortaea werneckii]|nr:hypothetical protein KC315_g37 [Hortaea werneckii]
MDPGILTAPLATGVSMEDDQGTAGSRQQNRHATPVVCWDAGSVCQFPARESGSEATEAGAVAGSNAAPLPPECSESSVRAPSFIKTIHQPLLNPWIEAVTNRDHFAMERSRFKTFTWRTVSGKREYVAQAPVHHAGPSRTSGKLLLQDEIWCEKGSLAYSVGHGRRDISIAGLQLSLEGEVWLLGEDRRHQIVGPGHAVEVLDCFGSTSGFKAFGCSAETVTCSSGAFRVPSSATCCSITLISICCCCWCDGASFGAGLPASSAFLDRHPYSRSFVQHVFASRSSCCFSIHGGTTSCFWIILFMKYSVVLINGLLAL